MIIDFLIKIWAFFVSLIPHFTVAVDTETTGLHGELLQVSLVSGSGRLLFNKYIKPDDATKWPEAQKINHISPLKVKFCRHISSYVPLINAYLRHTKKLIGYNHEGFDLPILENYGIRSNAKTVDIMLDDAGRRSRFGRSARWRKLVATAANYGYFFYAHDSLEDCLATVHINAFMHPGLNTIFYIIRKLARIIAGVFLIGYSITLPLYIPENAVAFSIFLPCVVIACWCYVYGPFTGLITTYIGLTLFPSESIPLLSGCLLALLLSIFYMFVKSPIPWIFRIPLAVLATVAGGTLALQILPDFLGTILNIQPVGSSEIINANIMMVFGIPFCFLLNNLLKRIL